MIGTILIIILILLLIGALPTWPYSTGWGYYPGGGIGLILIIVVVLILVGRIWQRADDCSQRDSDLVIRGSVSKLRHVQPQNPSGRVVPLPRPVPTISVRQLRPASAANYTVEAYLFRSAPESKCLRPSRRDNTGHPHISTRKQKASAASDGGGHFVRPIA
jgi:Protein of unknown function (DUF3309)